MRNSRKRLAIVPPPYVKANLFHVCIIFLSVLFVKRVKEKKCGVNIWFCRNVL
nr:MAG TPA: hypothetical protein [Caudoviricetes sp.]